MTKTAVFFADGFEEVEALTVVDLLRRAGISCRMVGVGDGKMATGSHDISVKMDCGIDDIDFTELDMIILPGGMPGTNNLRACAKLMDEVTKFDGEGKWLGAICAAPTVYGGLGLLKGRRACCYPGMEDGLEGAIATEDKVAVDGHFITSRGVGTAIPFALEIIRTFLGDGKAADMAKAIVYGL